MEITKEIALIVAHHKTEQISWGYEGGAHGSNQIIMTHGKPIYRFYVNSLKKRSTCDKSHCSFHFGNFAKPFLDICIIPPGGRSISQCWCH